MVLIDTYIVWHNFGSLNDFLCELVVIILVHLDDIFFVIIPTGRLLSTNHQLQL
jgi:hypothetical protein